MIIEQEELESFIRVTFVTVEFIAHGTVILITLSVGIFDYNNAYILDNLRCNYERFFNDI